MKVVGPDYIDYWHNYNLKNRVGVRVRGDCCWAWVEAGDDEASPFGEAHEIPIDLHSLPDYLRFIVEDDRANDPNSDLLDVLTGQKSFQEAFGCTCEK